MLFRDFSGYSGNVLVIQGFFSGSVIFWLYRDFSGYLEIFHVRDFLVI